MPSNKLTLAQVQWSNEGVPLSKTFDDYYFSSDDGLAEVEHTFIRCNQLADRFTEFTANVPFRIVETGFGSGLNFLRAAELWMEKASSQQKLHFISFEKYPMSLQDIKRAHDFLPKERTFLTQLATELQENYPHLLPGWHDVYLQQGRIRLTLWLGDVLKGLPELDGSSAGKVDAWFLDGFAPAKNPDMWQPILFQQMARLSHLETTFATFTAAGDVRRGLAKVGFKVEKSPGYGKKREMCFGTLQQQRPQSLKAPWFSRPEPLLNGKPGKVVVIGAGLAGAAVANKLAMQGWQVDVLEAEKEVATQASGNEAGTVHPLITADWNLRSQWYLLGFMATLRTIMPWLKELPDKNEMGDLSGLIELAMDEKTKNRNAESIERVGLPESLTYPISSATASELLDTKALVDGMLFPQGGWLYPKAVVEKCLAHDNVTLHCSQKVKNLTNVGSDEKPEWLVECESDEFSADAVIVTTGSLDNNLNQKLGLPIRPVKGQVTHLQETQQLNPLKKAVTHDGYSVSHSKGAVTGATFEAPDMSLEMSSESHHLNLQTAESALPDWLKFKANEGAVQVDGRVAFRPTTPDHLPIIGAVPSPEWMQEAYLSQSHTHAVYRYPEQQYQKGLYVSNGHGARGLMSVFLAAELLYAEISGGALPQPLSLYHACQPARFQIRNWRSGKLNEKM